VRRVLDQVFVLVHASARVLRRGWSFAGSVGWGALKLIGSVRDGGPGREFPHLPQIGSRISMQKLMELHLRKVLETTQSVSEAAAILGINRTTLYRMRKRTGLN